MTDYFERQTGAFPRRPNFARRNLMERQKTIPAGYKLPVPRPHQYGSPSTYSSSYAFGHSSSFQLQHDKTPRPPNTAPSAPTTGTGTDNNIAGSSTTEKPAPTRPNSSRLRPSRPPAMTSLIERLSRPTATSAAKRAKPLGWSDEGAGRALEEFAWDNMDVFVDTQKAFYTQEGSMRAPTSSLSQEVDCC